MENEEIIDLRNPTHKFAVSWMTIQVIAPPFINAWNSHRIPGQAGGVPNYLADTTRQINCHRFHLFRMQLLFTSLFTAHLHVNRHMG